MTKKHSSYKNHQLITENWRKFLTEGEGPLPSPESMEEFEESGGATADDSVVAWLESLPADQFKRLQGLSLRKAVVAILDLYRAATEEEENPLEDPANAERAIWAGYGRDPEQAISAALVEYAVEKMTHGLEVMNHDAATAEEEARKEILELVNKALDRAAEIYL